MSENIIVLHPERLEKIARYEITFKEVLKGQPFSPEKFSCPKAYDFTPEDLCHALKAMRAAGPSIGDLGEYWLYPISQLSEAFGLDRLLQTAKDASDVPDSMKIYPGLPLSGSRLFFRIWWSLQNIWEDSNSEKPLSDMLNLDPVIDELERFLANSGKPLEEWDFSEEEKEDYVRLFDKESVPEWAEAPQLALARKFTDELCEADNFFALRVKGYACYGGNQLYPCDWEISHDCITRLFELDDDALYANTLGYIYYYGRVDGAPDYEKAKHYFGIAAANGIHEGMYKLADLFRHGYGCRKSPRTARSLYGMVYEDSVKYFLQGNHGNFADAALRMGIVYSEGIAEEIDHCSAYHYYLQAAYAAALRAEDSDFFGDETVARNTQKALEEAEARLAEDYFEESTDHEVPVLFQRLCADNYRCVLTRLSLPDGCTRLYAERIPTHSVPKPEYILITIPTRKFCKRTQAVSYTADKNAQIWFKDDAVKVKFDYCCWNDVESRYDFIYDNEVTAWAKAENYRFIE